MIIDIRSHYKKIKETGSWSRQEIEKGIKRVMSYMQMRNELQKASIHKLPK